MKSVTVNMPARTDTHTIISHHHRHQSSVIIITLSSSSSSSIVSCITYSKHYNTVHVTQQQLRTIITCSTVVLQCYRRQAMEQAKIRPSVTLYSLDRSLPNLVWLITSATA